MPKVNENHPEESSITESKSPRKTQIFKKSTLSATTLMKHTAAVHISNILTLNQRKIANILLKNAYSELGNDKWHFIQMRDLLTQLGWKPSSNSTEMIKSDLRVLNTVQLEWNIFNQDRKRVWNITTFLSDAKIEQGTIKYSYSLAMRAALYNPNIYAKLDLLVQKLFKTKHALVLWEYICCELSTSGRSSITGKWMPLDDVRHIFGLRESKTYSSFNALNQKVLEPAIGEINGKSGISVIMETKKEHRKIDAVRFLISRFVAESSSADDKIFDNNTGELGVSPEKIRKDIESYGEDRVHFAMEYTRKQINCGKVINNVAAFYNVALRENWGESVTSRKVRAEEIDRTVKRLVGPSVFLEFMEDLKNRVGEDLFRTWFIDLEFVSVNDNKMTLKVDSNFKREYIETRFMIDIERAAVEKSIKIDLV